MMRLSSQRGVSLMLLIIMITVFAAVAMGIVTLLRSRHESYPYQVQSYQAYALAHAGVEFATRYVRDNQNGIISNMTDYIPQSSYKSFAFGNGTFELKYVPGCPDVLYSRGTVGTATREVQVLNFSLFAGSGGGNNTVYVSSGITKIPYSSAMIYSGYRLEFTFCDPSRFTEPTTWSWVVLNSVTFAATQPIRIMRFAMTMPGSSFYEWLYDGACGAGSMGSCAPFVLTAWDGTSDPPNASTTPIWNIRNPQPITSDNACRPTSCPIDAGVCPTYPAFSKTSAVCNMGGPQRTLPFGNWQGHFTLETDGNFLPTGTKLYVSFLHIPSGALAPDYSKQVLNKFIITVP
jgi:hypothetical protein